MDEAVSLALAGYVAYDDLSDATQAAVRRVWDERICRGITCLDLAEEFTAAGCPWPEADARGGVVWRTGIDES